MPCLLRAPAVLLQRGQGGGVGQGLIGADHRWLLPVIQTVQRFAKEALDRRRVSHAREIEINGVPIIVHGPTGRPNGRGPSHTSRRPATSPNVARGTVSAAASPSPAHNAEPSGRSSNDPPRRRASPSSARDLNSSLHSGNTAGPPKAWSHPRSDSP